MLSCPGYWLAPSLVALSAWICDNQSLAEKALAEAMRRDDSKASLFFALICRRGRRTDACVRWLVRYFQIQNPAAMDREVLIMLDALANGVFGGAAMTGCSAVVDGWLDQLKQEPKFSDQERLRWAEALDIMTPRLHDNEYPTLRKCSPDWPRLEASLAAARRNQVVQAFFEQMFTGEIVAAPSLEKAVDELLDSLVSNFDDRELPLRRKERFNEILIESDSLQCRVSEKRSEADRQYHSESDALKEQTSFATLLTNSALYPTRTGATRATQRYAVSCSRQWIIEGFNDLTTRDRAKAYAEVEIVCGSWKGKSRDGSNEQDLTKDLFEHYANRIKQAVNSFSMAGAWFSPIIPGALGLAIFAASDNDIKYLGSLLIAVAVALFYFGRRRVKQRRLRAKVNQLQEQGAAVKTLLATLAELTDIRREIATEDKKSDDVLVLLSALSSAEFVLNGPEKIRKILA